MCDVLCYSHKINEKMYLDFRNASILKRGKISLLCPCKKEFVVFQNGRRMAGRILFLSAICLSISGLVLVTYGHFITGNDVYLCWKQQSNVFELEDSGNLTVKVFCTRISRKDGLISILLAPNRRLQRRKNV